jgi:FKBP-type peptidyl-prolyl cis-trans isomerase FklB
MKKFVPALFACALTVASLSPAAEATELQTKKDKVSYSIGLQMGMQLSTLEDNIDINKIIMGLQDGQKGAEPKLSEDEIRTVMTEFQTEMQTRQLAKAQLQASVNKEEATTFLAENKNKEGVITLDSGLQYKIITKGTGPSPQATDTVSVHYRGTLINGKEFDSSYKREKPVEFPVNQVIAGWTEALQLMKVGSKWQIFIPADLAYGERGAGQAIEPNAMLIFEVELLEIKDK